MGAKPPTYNMIPEVAINTKSMKREKKRGGWHIIMIMNSGRKWFWFNKDQNL